MATLKAIASEGVVYSRPRPNYFKYHLAVRRLFCGHAIIDKIGMVYSDHEITGKLFYSVYDVLFQRGLNTFI